MKYFNLELLNAELNRLAENGAISIKFKQYLNQFLEEYVFDEQELRQAFSSQPLLPNDDFGFGEQLQNLPH